MPISKYILLALLASGAVAPKDEARSLGPEAIAQPAGGASSISQKGIKADTKKDGGKLTVASGKKGHKSRRHNVKRNIGNKKRTS